jgi:hypothetical protein
MVPNNRAANGGKEPTTLRGHYARPLCANTMRDRRQADKTPPTHKGPLKDLPQATAIFVEMRENVEYT